MSTPKKQAAQKKPPLSLRGVGPDEPTVVNERGAKQSHVPYRMDLIDGPAILEMAAVLSEGAEKYGEGNWRGISIEDHLNHLIIHAYAYLAGDRSDDHLSHAMCRSMFAKACAIDIQHTFEGDLDGAWYSTNE